MPTLLGYVISVRTTGRHSVLHKVYGHQVKNDGSLPTGQRRKENENTISQKERQNSPKERHLTHSGTKDVQARKKSTWTHSTLPLSLQAKLRDSIYSHSMRFTFNSVCACVHACDMCLHTQRERVCVICVCDYAHKSERLSDGEGLLSLCYLTAKFCGGKHS